MLVSDSTIEAPAILCYLQLNPSMEVRSIVLNLLTVSYHTLTFRSLHVKQPRRDFPLDLRPGPGLAAGGLSDDLFDNPGFDMFGDILACVYC